MVRLRDLIRGSIVMEYADDGDLFQRICDHQQDTTTFDESDIWTIFI